MVRAVLFALGLTACDGVFGLDRTRPAATDAAPPDFDGDGIADRDDNCPLVSNPLQENSDRDAFGDACDFCPGMATTINHDEDGDGVGDECDLCPVDADFQTDTDFDGVGDACDPNPDKSLADTLIAFDPFLSLDAWTPVGTSWVDVGDAVAPESGLTTGDGGLQRSTVGLPGSQLWLVHTMLRSTQTWQDGDSFGVGLVDAGGSVVAGCFVKCATTCELTVRGPAQSSSPVGVGATPIELLEVHYTPGTLNCAVGSDRQSLTNVTLPDTIPALFGEPKIQFSSFAAWR